MRLRPVLISTIVILGAFGLAAELWQALAPSRTSEAFVGLFSLSMEGNIPTWYASSLLFLCGVCLTVIAAEASRSRESCRWHWWGLVVVFFYISLDEAVGFHENLTGLFETGGLFYFDWVIPVGIALVLFALAYLPFLKNLPEPTRSRFIVAGAIYVFGALVMELPLGFWAERHGDENLTYALIDWIEEVLELLGVSLFLSALWEDARLKKVLTERSG